MKLLHVDSSILGEGSVSRTLSAEIVEAFRADDPGLDVKTLDLAVTPLRHLTGAHMAVLQGAPAEDSDIATDVEAGKTALDDFLAADIVVVGAPMYNFGIPSQLKAWIDRLAVAGKTFTYEPTGPKGLVHGKKMVIASARGGVFSPGSPAAALDHQESYLRTLFGFLGVTDLVFVRAESVAMGPEVRNRALGAAREVIGSLAA